jgi:hypothetical protein
MNMDENKHPSAAAKKTDAPLPSIGSTPEKDDALAAAKAPLGAAVEVNKEKKVEGLNRPST